MRMVLFAVASVSIALAAFGCNDERRLTVLFTGDEHNYMSPVG